MLSSRFQLDPNSTKSAHVLPWLPVIFRKIYLWRENFNVLQISFNEHAWFRSVSQLIRSRKISQFSSKNFARAPRLTRSEKFHRSLRDLFDPDFFFFYYYLRARGRIHNEFSLPSILSLSLFFLETSLDISTNEKKKFPHLPETQVWMTARMMIYCLFREGNKERLERRTKNTEKMLSS